MKKCRGFIVLILTFFLLDLGIVLAVVSSPCARKKSYFTPVLSRAHAMDQNHNGNTSNKNFSKKVVKAEEIDKILLEGCEPMMTLPYGGVVMKALR